MEGNAHVIAVDVEQASGATKPLDGVSRKADGSQPARERQLFGWRGMRQPEQMTNLKVLDLSFVAECTLRSRLERQAEVSEHAIQNL